MQVLTYAKGSWKWAPMVPKPYTRREPVVKEAPAAAVPAEDGEAPATPAEGGDAPAAPVEGEAPAEGDAAAAPAEGEAAAPAEGEAAATAEGAATPAGDAEPPKPSGPGQPLERYGLGGVVVSGRKLLLFGGEAKGTLQNEFLTVDLGLDGNAAWSQPNVNGEEPGPRIGASVAIHGNRLFIFGGKGRNASEEEFLFEDLVVLTVDPASCDVTVETEVKTKGTLPGPRTGALFMPYHADSMVLMGGLDAAGKPINDAHILNCKTLHWTRVYLADPELLPAGGMVGSVMGGRILSFTSSAGATRLDLVQSLDAQATQEHWAFTKFMTDSVAKELAALEKFVSESLSTFKSASDLAKLAADFPQLMRIMEALFQARRTLRARWPHAGGNPGRLEGFLAGSGAGECCVISGCCGGPPSRQLGWRARAQVKTRRNSIDLELDCLRETLGLLAKQKVNVVAKEKSLAAIDEAWAGLKKMMPSVKSDVQPIQAPPPSPPLAPARLRPPAPAASKPLASRNVHERSWAAGMTDTRPYRMWRQGKFGPSARSSRKSAPRTARNSCCARFSSTRLATRMRTRRSTLLRRSWPPPARRLPTSRASLTPSSARMPLRRRPASWRSVKRICA